MAGLIQVSEVARPSPPLRRFIGTYSGYRFEGLPPGVHAGLPGRSLTVIIAFDEPLNVSWHDGHSDRTEQLWISASGLHDRPVAVHHNGIQHGIQIDVTPSGARALFGLPAGALARDTVDALEVFGRRGRELLDRLAGTPTWAGRFRVLDDVFMAIVDARSRSQPERSELMRAWTLLNATNGLVRIDQVATDLRWSRRHLHTQFRAEFGLSPKVMAQVIRFDRANRRLRGWAPESLATVAAESGYADQAHLTREFVRFAGSPPTIWRSDPLLFSSVQDADLRTGEA